MIQWNFPDSKYSVLVTSDLNTIGWFIFQEKTSRAKKFSAPANQRPKELQPPAFPEGALPALPLSSQFWKARSTL